MTTYAEAASQISRKPVTKVVITGSRCSLTYGVSPCTATGSAGSECYNSWATCQDLVNYDVEDYDISFSSINAAALPQARPYISSVSQLPTKLGEKLTARARVKIVMIDEPSDDIGVDPYVANRSSTQGEYWKKFTARNPNYEGWEVKVYQGFTGVSEFKQRWKGNLDNIKNSKGSVTLEAVDTLAIIEKVSIPEKIDSELLTTITDSQTTIVLTTVLKADGVQIDSSGYVQIDDELVSYSSVTPAANQLNGCVRGVFSTTAVAHDEGARTSLVKYYAPENPFVIMKNIWDEAGGSYVDDFNLTKWTNWQSWPKEDEDFSAIVLESDSVTASDLFWEIANLLDVHVWQDEDQKISVMRKISNMPGREYTALTDTANIIDKSTTSDYNSKSRKTRVTTYWGKKSIGEDDKPASFDRVSLIVDVDAESEEGYDGEKPETIFSRWVSTRYIQEETIIRYVSAIIRRRLFIRRDARAITKASIDPKDESLLTGDSVTLISSELVDIHGNPRANNNYIISRQKKGGKIALELKELPRKRICFIAPSGHPDYSDSTDAEREYGYICNSNGDMPSDLSPGYHIY